MILKATRTAVVLFSASFSNIVASPISANDINSITNCCSESLIAEDSRRLSNSSTVRRSLVNTKKRSGHYSMRVEMDLDEKRNKTHQVTPYFTNVKDQARPTSQRGKKRASLDTLVSEIDSPSTKISRICSSLGSEKREKQVGIEKRVLLRSLRDASKRKTSQSKNVHRQHDREIRHRFRATSTSATRQNPQLTDFNSDGEDNPWKLRVDSAEKKPRSNGTTDLRSTGRPIEKKRTHEIDCVPSKKDCTKIPTRSNTVFRNIPFQQSQTLKCSQQLAGSPFKQLQSQEIKISAESRMAELTSGGRPSSTRNDSYTLAVVPKMMSTRGRTVFSRKALTGKKDTEVTTLAKPKPVSYFAKKKKIAQLKSICSGNEDESHHTKYQRFQDLKKFACDEFDFFQTNAAREAVAKMVLKGNQREVIVLLSYRPELVDVRYKKMTIPFLILHRHFKLQQESASLSSDGSNQTKAQQKICRELEESKSLLDQLCSMGPTGMEAITSVNREMRTATGECFVLIHTEPVMNNTMIRQLHDKFDAIERRVT